MGKKQPTMPPPMAGAGFLERLGIPNSGLVWNAGSGASSLPGEGMGKVRRKGQGAGRQGRARLIQAPRSELSPVPGTLSALEGEEDQSSALRGSPSERGDWVSILTESKIQRRRTHLCLALTVF